MAVPIDTVYFQNCMEANIRRGLPQEAARAICYPVAIVRAVPAVAPAPPALVPTANGAALVPLVPGPSPWLIIGGLALAAAAVYYLTK